MAEAKQRVHVTFDQEWLSKVVGLGVQQAFDGYNQSLQSMIADEVDQALRKHLVSALRDAAKVALKEQIGRIR